MQCSNTKHIKLITWETQHFSCQDPDQGLWVVMTERLSLCSRANVLGEGWSAGTPAHPLTPFHPQGWHGWVRGTLSTSLLSPPVSSLGLFTDRNQSQLILILKILCCSPYDVARFNMCLAWNPRLPTEGGDISDPEIYFMTSACCYSAAVQLDPPFPRFYFG